MPSSIPLRRDPVAGGSADSDFSGMAVVGLMLVIAVFAWSWWRARRKAGAAGGSSPRWAAWLGAPASSSIRVASSMRLTPRHTLHEVEWEGRKLLVGCSDQGMNVLAESSIVRQADAGTGSVARPADPGAPT